MLITSRRSSRMLFAVALPMTAAAQSGRISGTVTDANARPIAGAQILLPAAGLGARSGEGGSFTVQGVPVGTYALRVYRLGYRPKDVAGVLVSRASTTTVSVRLESTPVDLAGLVVSASRRVEKITDAPATVTRLDTAQLANSIGNSFMPALKNVNGIEFIQVGVTNVTLNARGFNLSFNNRLLMIEDGRIATLAESGLPVALQTTIPKVDLAAVEMLVGPGAALYGPDASSGVLTLETKDPRQSRGWTGEVTGGSRSFYDAQGRYATTFGNVGVKVAAERQSASDFTNTVFYPGLTAGAQPIKERDPDFNTNITRGSGALAWYLDNDARVIVNVGASRMNGMGQTSVGRNQLVNYDYRDYQLQYTGSRWFAQAYMTNSLTNGTFALNGYSQSSVRYPTLSTDSLKRLSAFPAEGRIQATEIQNNFTLGSLAGTGVSAVDNTHVIWGAQLRRDWVSSHELWLSDRVGKKPILRDERGIYSQVETPLTEQLRLVGALRYDTHDRYDAQFSPKAAMLFSPAPDHTLRVTYNRAYKSPTVLQTDISYPNLQPFVGVFGDADGFDIKRSDGSLVNIIQPLRAETNTTWEVGYKGASSNRVFGEIAAYRSHFNGFLGPLVTIANPLSQTTPTTAYNHRTGAKITDPNGGPQVTLTYFNVGEATITGVEAGLRYYVSDRLSTTANVNLIGVDTIKSNPTDPPEATAFNSASVRATAGLDYQDDVRTGGLTMRYVNGYDFRGGVNFGRIPSFATIDISATYRIASLPLKVLFQAQNLFACVGGTSTPPATGISAAVPAAYVGGRQCAFGQSHTEMLNMPAIGAMVFLGLRAEGALPR